MIWSYIYQIWDLVCGKLLLDLVKEKTFWMVNAHQKCQQRVKEIYHDAEWETGDDGIFDGDGGESDGADVAGKDLSSSA